MSTTAESSTDPALEHDLLAVAFDRLRATGQPIRAHELATVLQRDHQAVEASLRRLDRAGRLRRDPAGRVTGGLGLSVTPTAHELVLDGRRFWTWCAYDAVGIVGALHASGQIRSRSPLTGARIELAFQDGQPPAAEVVVFLAARDDCTSIVEEWCPLINFFEHAEAAATWAGQEHIAGKALSLAEATASGTATWQSWLRRTDADQD